MLPLSIGIPLYRSRPFVDDITRNVAAIERPDVEIVISDRHQDDDALAVLTARLRGDGRVRFLAASDRIGWVDHYNLLLREARGRAFMWMSHDDRFPAGHVAALAAALDARPDAVAAYGRVVPESADGRRIRFGADPADRRRPGEPWSVRAALDMLVAPGLNAPPFHGLVRRDRIVDAGLFIRHTHGDFEADVYWVFGLALLGPLVFVPDCSFGKRVHDRSASAAWGARRLIHVVDGLSAPLSYVRRFAADAGDARTAAIAVSAWAALRLCGWVTRDWGLIPPQRRRSIRDAAIGAITGRALSSERAVG